MAPSPHQRSVEGNDIQPCCKKRHFDVVSEQPCCKKDQFEFLVSGIPLGKTF